MKVQDNEAYTHDELMKTLASLAEYGYCSMQGIVKVLVDKSLAELENPDWNYQYAIPTNKGLIELGEWVLEE